MFKLFLLKSILNKNVNDWPGSIYSTIIYLFGLVYFTIIYMLGKRILNPCYAINLYIVRRNNYFWFIEIYTRLEPF
jgi:hypothetical protein